jgi:nucleotide-binding universal stress UspA family protein
MALIVVGVDGSEGSRAALRFAAGEAALRDAKLRIVCAWEIPAAVYASTWGLPADAEAGFDELARDIAAEAMSEAARLEPGVDRESRAISGQPSHVLVQESRDADLLVVGSRGLGGFRSLLLGSVGQQVAHHATCPVVIVPPLERRKLEAGDQRASAIAAPIVRDDQ